MWFGAGVLASWGGLAWEKVGEWGGGGDVSCGKVIGIAQAG